MHPPGTAPELIGTAFAQFAAGWMQLVLCFNNAYPTQHSVGAGPAGEAESAKDDECEYRFHALGARADGSDPADLGALRKEQKAG